jgi:hypothetical protein
MQDLGGGRRADERKARRAERSPPAGHLQLLPDQLFRVVDYDGSAPTA